MNLFREINTEDSLNYYIQIGFLVSDILIFTVLFFIKAYYGKFYSSKSLLPPIPSHISWIIQEIPCVIITIYYIYNNSILSFKLLFIIPFLLHYIHRSLIFPFMISSSKNNPLEITLMALTFCVFNATIQNRSIYLYINYTIKDVLSLQFFFGSVVMLIGMIINIFHDYYMIKLRNQKKGQGYILPYGFLYNFISCPNYFGEIIEWGGYWMLTGNFSAFVFFISTVANLFPRAIKYHHWYKEKFREEYPLSRKAIIPFVI